MRKLLRGIAATFITISLVWFLAAFGYILTQTRIFDTGVADLIIAPTQLLFMSAIAYGANSAKEEEEN